MRLIKSIKIINGVKHDFVSTYYLGIDSNHILTICRAQISMIRQASHSSYQIFFNRKYDKNYKNSEEGILPTFIITFANFEGICRQLDQIFAPTIPVRVIKPDDERFVQCLEIIEPVYDQMRKKEDIKEIMNDAFIKNQ
jgi:hypothetical protein